MTSNGSCWLVGSVIAALSSAGCMRLDGSGLTGDSDKPSAQRATAGRGATSKPPSALAIASAQSCALASFAPTLSCLDFDPVEIDDDARAVPLPVEPVCGFVMANITGDEQDAYAFTITKANPVLVEVSYVGAGKADLEQSVYGVTGDLLRTDMKRRMGVGEDLRSVIQGSAGSTYTVRIKDSNESKSCQSYALRIQPNYCGDDYEDNDSSETAAKLTWDENQRATAQGKLLDTDPDYFELTTERADPVLLTGSYSAAVGSTVQVRRRLYDGAGSLKLDVSGARRSETETISHWLPAASKKSVLRTLLTAEGDGCATYDLTFDAAACTDPYEDNDLPDDAAQLPIGKDVQATIFEGDNDYYALPALKSGACTVSYDIPTGRDQQLDLTIYDGAGSTVAAGGAGDLTGTTRTVRVSWGDREAHALKLSARQGGYCQPYKLRCDMVTSQ